MRRRVIWATFLFLLAAIAVLLVLRGRDDRRRSVSAPGAATALDAPASDSSGVAGPEATGSGAIPDAPSDPHARRLRVRVIDAKGPLQGAEVCVDDIVAVTGADGTAEIGTDDLDITWVRASKEGFLESEGEFPGGVDEGEIFLMPGVPLRGQVVRAADGKPVAGASVRSEDQAGGGELCRALTTDADGRFTVPGVAPGTHFVVGASFEGYAPAATTGVATVGAEVRIVLGAGATLAGTVCGIDGKPAAGVAIRAFLADDWWLAKFPDWSTMQQNRLRAAARAGTGVDGTYRIEGLVPGEYTVLAHASGGSAKTSVAVPLGAAVKLDLTLEPTASILVRVLDPDDRAVPRARLAIYDAKGNLLVGPRIAQRTDASGEGLAAGLEPGGYKILVQPARWTPARADVVIERGPPAHVELRVAAGSTLEGTVCDPAGGPVPGVNVQFTTPGDALVPPQDKNAATSRDGRFVLEGLLRHPGTLTVSDLADRWSTWEGEALPGGPSLSVVVRGSASVSGRLEPPPASRRVAYDVAAGDGARSWSVDLDAEGKFVIVGMEEGQALTICFDVPGGIPVRCAVAALLPGERRDLGTLVVAPGRVLRGRALDKGGQPWALTRIELGYDEEGFCKYTLTDAHGNFAFEHVDPASAIAITVWNTETSGQTFELEDWTEDPVHELVVERAAPR